MYYFGGMQKNSKPDAGVTVSDLKFQMTWKANNKRPTAIATQIAMAIQTRAPRNIPRSDQ